MVFLAFEVRQSRQVGQLEYIAANTDARNQVRELLLANAEIWTRGCSGEELSTSERTVYAQLYRAYVHNLFWTWMSADGALIDLGSTNAINMFASNFHRYPGFAAMAQQQEEWFETVEADSDGVLTAFSEAVTIGSQLVRHESAVAIG